MKIVLGTANFCQSYGYKKKKITKTEFKKIKKIITRNKIAFFDSATSYGKSHEIIGNNFKKKKIITKFIIPKKKNINLKIWLENHIKKILKDLKINNIYALLFHNVEDLNANKNIINLLTIFKKKKIIKHLGVSIYCPEDIIKILKFWTPDFVQFPINIFDNRMKSSGLLKFLGKQGVILNARSLFLQGKLLSSNSYFNDVKSNKLFEEYNFWCHKNNINRLEYCLNYTKKIKEIDLLTVGFENASQLQEILKIFYSKNKKRNMKNFYTDYKKLIDPRKW